MATQILYPESGITYSDYVPTPYAPPDFKVAENLVNSGDATFIATSGLQTSYKALATDIEVYPTGVGVFTVRAGSTLGGGNLFHVSGVNLLDKADKVIASGVGPLSFTSTTSIQSLNLTYNHTNHPWNLDEVKLSWTNVLDTTGSGIMYGAELAVSGDNIPPTRNIPLYMKGFEAAAVQATDNMPLYVWSISSESGVKNETTLFIQGLDNLANSGTMSLYMPNPPTPVSAETSTMNLMLKGLGNADGWQNSSAEMTLFAYNNWAGENSGVPLVMWNQGGTSGAIPNSGSMNLFIKRPSEDSVADTTPLYILGQPPNSGETPLYIHGIIPSGEVPLYINGVGKTTSNVTLYTHGF